MTKNQGHTSIQTTKKQVFKHKTRAVNLGLKIYDWLLKLTKKAVAKSSFLRCIFNRPSLGKQARSLPTIALPKSNISLSHR